MPKLWLQKSWRRGITRAVLVSPSIRDVTSVVSISSFPTDVARVGMAPAMRLPNLRFTIRRLMIVIAIVGFGCRAFVRYDR
jgi:hypothetical protein